MATRSERIQTGRKAMELSLEELGDIIGVEKATVSKWENHKNGTPDIELHVFFKLAQALEIDARELATGKPPDAGTVPPNMLSLIDDYSAIDVEVRRPVRALIRKLAEQSKAVPRKAREKKTKPRETEQQEIK